MRSDVPLFQHEMRGSGFVSLSTKTGNKGFFRTPSFNPPQLNFCYTAIVCLFVCLFVRSLFICLFACLSLSSSKISLGSGFFFSSTMQKMFTFAYADIFKLKILSFQIIIIFRSQPK